MKANELRIGNYFHPCDTRSGVLIPNTSVIWTVGSIDKFGKIAVIDYDKPNNIYLTVNECSPIPLTEEWLQKFGFTHTKYGGTYLYECFELSIEAEYNQAAIVGHKTKDEPLKCYFEDIDSQKIGNEIQYVHTLQNLYFALTGNELQIK